MAPHQSKVVDSILYELLVYSEWIQEPEILLKLMKPQNKLLSIATRPWTLKYLLPYTRAETVNDKIARLVSARLAWQFAVGEEGKVVAIIQDTLLEIRTSRDEYSSVVGRASIARDHFPQYRKAVWSPDCSLLACAFSSGRIGLYDLLGSNILNIEPRNQQPDEWPSTDEAIAGIFFLDDRVKSPKWSYELIAVDYRGHLRSFLVSPTEGFREHHTFSFASYYRNGITSLNLIHPGNLLILAGPSDIQLEQKGRGSSAGLSAWRILSDHPFYSPALSSEEDLVSIQGSRGLWAWMPSFRSTKQSDVMTMRVSPGARLLACLHASGAVSLWQLPSLRLFKHWNLAEQPDHNARNPQLVATKPSSEPSMEFLPVDISWWSENVLIIARFSGSVSVCSTTDLHNLLGEYPEFFAGPPQVSAASGDGRGFLSLECEVNVSSKQPCLDDSTEQGDETSSDEVEPGDSLFGRSTSAIRHTLYWVTDSERFRTPRPKPRILKKTYRLLGLKSTTPEELYARKINNEEYGEALQLARTYGLDCDLVYQRQWRSQNVSVTTIHDYLSKINKRSWVLRECIERVPESATAARELLLFGLQATNLKVLLSVNPATSDLCPEVFDEEEEKQVNVPEIINELKETELNSEQQDILRSRIKLLKYLDMLSTYEIILGGGSISEELYDAPFYAKFRCQPVLQSVVEFAHNGQWQAVGCMLTYHSKQLLRHRLPIISSFPETMGPFEYRALLPECEDDKVVPWPIDDLREQDWCEELNLSVDDDSEACSFLYSEETGLLEYCTDVLSPEQLCVWYIAQATQLEQRSKMVDHALSLITLGQERSVQGLDGLMAELLTLEVLVYEVQIEDLSLSTLRQHSSLSQAHLLMSKSTAENFVDNAKRWFLPHLIRCEKKTPGSRKQLLREFLVNLSGSSLLLPLQVFKQFKQDPPGPLFTSIEEAISVALDCLYSYQGTDQLNLAFEFLECLPEKGFGEKNKVMLDLHYRVDHLEGHLAAADILSRYTQLGVPLFKLRSMEGDEQAALRTLVQVARSMPKRVPPPTQAQWKELLKDMLTLQAKVFSCVLLEKCFEIYAETLLASGSRSNIRYAGTIMECSKTDTQDSQQKIRYEVGIRLVLNASREYFDSAGSFNDPNMELAKSCLLLITDDQPEIKEERDLIAALQLLGDFGVKMLPIQVRLCSDKLRLLRDCLKVRPVSYRNTQRLLQLADFLRVAGEDSRAREASVLVLVAEAALQASDYTCCAEICQKMMDQSHSAGWQVAQSLAQCSEYDDIESRHRLLAFSILHCEPAAIEHLISYRCKLEAQMLHKEINKQVPPETNISMLPSSPSLDEFSDALSSPEVETRSFPGIQSLPQLIQQSAEVLRDTTHNILLNAGDENFWRSAFQWIQQPNGDSGGSVTDSVVTQGFHAFYMSLHSANCHESSLGVHYDSFALPTISDPSLELLLQLVRVSLLEELEDANDVTLTDDVILKASKELTLEDCHIGLCLLLALKDISRAKELFLQLPRSFVSLQLAAYYFALLVCMEELPSDDMDSKHNAFLCDPHKLTELVHHGRIKNGKATPRSQEARALLASFQSQQSELLLSLQLQSLNCGVDSMRFSHDDQYRQDSILGLAMTEDEEQFELAQSLAERFDVPMSHLAVARLSHLLLGEEECSQEKLLSVLAELEQHLDETVFPRMEQEVLHNISGTDHQRLLCFFLTLQQISDTSVVMCLHPSQHVRLIKQVKSTLRGIDYKVLVAQPDEVLQMLRPLLSQDNISAVAKLLDTLPSGLQCLVQPSTLFTTWIQKLFFEVSRRASDEQWMAKLEMSKDFFPKLSCHELIDLTSDLVFSEQSYSCIPLSCRLTILQEILKFCRSRQHIEEWGQTAGLLQQWTSHLSGFAASHTTPLSTLKCQELVRRVQLSKGETSTIVSLREEILQSDVPLSTVIYLFSLQPQSFSSLSQYLLDKLQEAKENNRPELISPVLRRIGELHAENPELAKNMHILREQLSPLGADPNLDPSARLQALRLIQLTSPEQGQDQVDSTVRRALYTTEAILASAWPSRQYEKPSNLDDKDAINNLFASLLEESKSWEQLMACSELLRAWHSAGVDCSNLWIQLVEAMASQEKEDELFTWLLELFKTVNILPETMLELLKPLKNVHYQLRLCLVTMEEKLHTHCILLLQQQDKELLADMLDGEILDMFVSRKLVTQLVPTAAYPHLVAHLLMPGQEELLKSSLRQLVSGSMQAEAATLYGYSVGLPASLSSFSTTMSIFPLHDYSP